MTLVRQSKHIDFSQGPVWRCILAQAVPLTIAQLVQLLYNIVDRIYIGHMARGSGIALISSGIAGIVAGTMLTLLLLFLGREKMESAVMNMDLPGVVRKLVPRGYFESRMEKISGEVKRTCFETMEKDKSEEVSRRMISEISSQIEECLMRMAEVVEIPLGN